MGYWSENILDGDLPQDIYNDFFDYYNDKIEVSQIITDLKEQYQDTLNSDEKSIFWFSLAQALWETGNLSKEVLDQVDLCIASNYGDLESWAAAGGDLKKRAATLKKFYAKLTSENKKPKKPITKRKFKPLFSEGDILAFPLADGHYTAFYVTRAEEDYGMNNLLPIDVYSQTIPTLPEVLQSKILLVAKSRYENGRIEEHSKISDSLKAITLFSNKKFHKDISRKCHFLGNAPRQTESLYFRKLNFRINITGSIFMAPIEKSIITAINDFRESVLFNESTPLGLALVKPE